MSTVALEALVQTRACGKIGWTRLVGRGGWNGHPFTEDSQGDPGWAQPLTESQNLAAPSVRS